MYQRPGASLIRTPSAETKMLGPSTARSCSDVPGWSTCRTSRTARSSSSDGESPVSCASISSDTFAIVPSPGLSLCLPRLLVGQVVVLHEARQVGPLVDDLVVEQQVL